MAKSIVPLVLESEFNKTAHILKIHSYLTSTVIVKGWREKAKKTKEEKKPVVKNLLKTLF